jgi:hypothetical protein
LSSESAKRLIDQVLLVGLDPLAKNRIRTAFISRDDRDKNKPHSSPISTDLLTQDLIQAAQYQAEVSREEVLNIINGVVVP